MEPSEPPLDDDASSLIAEPLLVNVGPAHPATDGTVRIVIELDGERVVRSDVQIGYLHRGFEKMCERGCWTQVFPYADWLNYVSPMLNSVGYALTCEKLLGVEVPERCQWYRMILGELTRLEPAVCRLARCPAAVTSADRWRLPERAFGEKCARGTDRA